jgi:nitrite reductase/ring-hydroxylating ferredoxin subunit
MNRILGIILTATALLACKKQQDQVPIASVNFSVNVSNPSYLSIQSPGGWVYVSGGSLGIVIYRNSQTEFSAYDRHSPYMVENRCRVEVDSSNFFVVDYCSDSKFLLTDGSPVSGPASNSLTTYQTSFNQNSNVLRVYN